jgi:phage-related protein
MTTFFVAELHKGLFDSPRVLIPAKTDGWRFFSHCEGNDITTCTLLFQDLRAMTPRTRKDFINLWEFLFEAGKAGKPWKAIFSDGKLFHPVHSFEVERVLHGKKLKQTCEVHQFKKKRTDVRVLFVYGGKQLVAFVTHAFEKDDAKTPNSEKSRAEQMATEFFRALDESRIQLIEAQGGKHATQGIF